MAVDNAVCLELGMAGYGIVADNCHVGPMHPEHDPSVTRIPHDPAGAKALMDEAGMGDYEHELISIDDDWRRNTTDAIAAELRDAGIKVKRTIIAGNSFWNNWTQYPFSTTNWNMRPLGVQVLALAYRSGEAWNETAFADEKFDRVDRGPRGAGDTSEKAVVVPQRTDTRPLARPNQRVFEACERIRGGYRGTRSARQSDPRS